MRSIDGPRRQRRVTELHPLPSGLQHTARSHYQLYQSINEYHKVDIIFDARRRTALSHGYMWFYKYLIRTSSKIKLTII